MTSLKVLDDILLNAYRAGFKAALVEKPENALPACPDCGAPAGKDCRTIQGRIQPHESRLPSSGGDLVDIVRAFVEHFHVYGPQMRWEKSSTDDGLRYVANQGDIIFWDDPNHNLTDGPDDIDSVRFDKIVAFANAAPAILAELNRRALSQASAEGRREGAEEMRERAAKVCSDKSKVAFKDMEYRVAHELEDASILRDLGVWMSNAADEIRALATPAGKEG